MLVCVQFTPPVNYLHNAAIKSLDTLNLNNKASFQQQASFVSLAPKLLSPEKKKKQYLHQTVKRVYLEEERMFYCRNTAALFPFLSAELLQCE